MAIETVKLGNTKASREFLALKDSIEQNLMKLDWFIRRMEAKKGVYQAEDEFLEISEWLGMQDNSDPLVDAKSAYQFIKWAGMAMIDADETKVANINKMLFEIAGDLD